jgi:hypothetical integral membrane protein (TIGR02206 family)
MLAIVSSVAYGLSVVLGVLVSAALCVGARRRPGRWTIVAAPAIGLILAADAVSFAIAQAAQGTWSPATSLPLALCNMAVLVAIAACWWQIPLLVELTWFWGLAGALQAVVTPDLAVGFPHLEFFQYVVGHLGIVLAAVFLVVGLRITPRTGAVRRTFTVTAAYTAGVGLVDAVTGANYMFLRKPPPNWTVLRLLGPWPWYIPDAASVALVLLVVLDAPFRRARRDPSGERRRY